MGASPSAGCASALATLGSVDRHRGISWLGTTRRPAEGARYIAPWPSQSARRATGAETWATGSLDCAPGCQRALNAAPPRFSLSCPRYIYRPAKILLTPAAAPSYARPYTVGTPVGRANRESWTIADDVLSRARAACPADLPGRWRARAATLAPYSGPAARAFQLAAHELEAALAAQGDDLVTLTEAARASGYSRRPSARRWPDAAF